MWSIEDLVGRMHAALQEDLCGSVDFSNQDSLTFDKSADCNAYMRQIAEKELEMRLKTFVAFKTVSCTFD